MLGGGGGREGGLNGQKSCPTYHEFVFLELSVLCTVKDSQSAQKASQGLKALRDLHNDLVFEGEKPKAKKLSAKSR